MKVCFISLLVILTANSAYVMAQTSEGASAETQLAQVVKQLQQQVEALKSSVADLRKEAERYRTEAGELTRRLDAVAPPSSTTTQTAGSVASSAVPTDKVGADSGAGVSKLEDEYALLEAKVDDQYQTKVESASRYRVRLSGLVMMNLFSNRGVPDSIDSPSVANPASLYSGGSFAGSLRQSQIGIEVFGPDWKGAKVSGDVRFDFAGGFPNIDNGVTFGLMRLRTGNVRFNWSHTVIIAGQDSPMFSPLAPTSVIALAQPDFAYAGNLWSWVPQVQIQHWKDVGASQRVSIAVGIVDPLTGEIPSSQFLRTAQAGEASRQPGYSARIGWSDLRDEDHPRTLAVSGYFSRQNWGFNRNVNGWAVTADGETALRGPFSLKAEFYRGSAIGGFGASEGQSVISSGLLQNPATAVRGLNVIGGWAQAGVRVSSTLQFNAGYGLDNPLAHQLRQSAAAQYTLYPGLGVNRSAIANLIYRPRSDLLFSVEYRRLMASDVLTSDVAADNIGMGIGIVF